MNVQSMFRSIRLNIISQLYIWIVNINQQFRFLRAYCGDRLLTYHDMLQYEVLVSTRSQWHILMWDIMYLFCQQQMVTFQPVTFISNLKVQRHHMMSCTLQYKPADGYTSILYICMYIPKYCSSHKLGSALFPANHFTFWSWRFPFNNLISVHTSSLVGVTKLG